MPKNRVQKAELMTAYKEVVAQGNFVVVETNQVPAAVVTNLRKLLAPFKAKMYVIKDTVFTKAAQEVPALKEQTFVGQLSVVEGGEDIASSIKQFEEATKQAKAVLALTGADEKVVASYVPFTFKFGFINNTVLNDKDVIRVSKLPDKKALLAQVVGTMAAPISSIMNVMNGVPRAFLYALTDLKNKKA